MQRLTRAAPFPIVMQGRWIEVDNPRSEMVIRGGEVACFGADVEYDYKEIAEIGDALTVSLKILDGSAEDTFQRANITELVIDPDGQFHAYSVKFVSTFVRPLSDVVE